MESEFDRDHKYIRMMKNIGRRAVVRDLAIMGAASTIPFKGFFDGRDPGFKIGACDWSLGQRSSVEAMAVAREIGLDGVQISLGTVEDNMHLRSRSVQRAYKKACREFEVEVAGVAIGELNKVPYKSDPRTELWVSDSIDAAKAMGVKVVLLAFFSDGDIKNDPEGTEEVIRRLKRVVPKAEKEGIFLGIESWLSAEEHMYIINAVGSDHLKVYYDTANSNKMGYDIYEEIRWLGSEQICEVHMKENGNLLGQGVVDFTKVRAALDAINYRGWVQIEGAVPPGADMVTSHQANCIFLREILKTNS